VKVNRKNLFKLIAEAMEDDELTPRSDFEKLMSALTSDLSNARQAWEMYDLGAYELTPEEDAKARNAMYRAIITDEENDEVIPTLQEMGFSFHNEFTQVYGVTPPNVPFEIEPDTSGFGDDQIALRIKIPIRLKFGMSEVDRTNELEFHFWWEGNHPEHPADPWIYMLAHHADDKLENIYIDQDKGQLKVEYDGGAGTVSSKLKKEDIPTIIRHAMGWSMDEDPPEWPGLPKGQPPAEGPEGTDEPVYEGKQKLNKSYLMETINEVLQESELSEKEKIEQYLHSNNGEDFVWGLEMCHMMPELCSRRRIPEIINSQVMSGKYAGHDWVFLLVKTEEEANDLYWFLRTMRPKSSMTSRKGMESYMFKWPASEGSPFQVDIDMEYEEGNYIVEIVLDALEDKVPQEDDVEEGKRTMDRNYLFETIAEVMSEIEENFGETPDGDLLHEAWDSQWPSHFSELKERIKEYTDKGRVAEDILSKYALEAMSFNHLGFKTIWNAYGRLFKAFVRTYARDEGDLTKVRKLITNSLSSKSAEDWRQKFLDARRDKGNEGALRVLNKLISSLDKQIRKAWRSMEDKGVDWNNVEEEFDREITQAVQKQQFRESAMITSRILEIIQFVEMDKSDDNAKKLAAFYKKIKQAANSPEIDVSAIADEVNIVQLSLDFVEDQMMNIDMTLCPDAEVGAPCVMHNFEDGFFWYDISADTCELTARKMNSCGDASMSGSELFNLMSHSETGKPRWHVTVEWNEEEKAFIQVLGNANTVPKQEYWPYIKWLYEKYGKPEISNYAWEHVQGDNVKPRVFAFLQYLGLKSRDPLSETWVQMKQQISDGFYNVRSWEGERGPTDVDFAKLWWTAHADRVSMGMRIKRRLIAYESIEKGLIQYDDIRDYKTVARKLQNEGTVESLVFQDLMPSEWDEFFSSEGITQRIRFSHNGNMVIYFNWTSKKLQDPSDGNYRDDEYMKELQRKALARFMNEAKHSFTVEAMTKVGKLIGDQLEKDADDWAMKRDAYNRGDDLDEESQRDSE
jgi:hypothetical protein